MHLRFCPCLLVCLLHSACVSALLIGTTVSPSPVESKEECVVTNNIQTSGSSYCQRGKTSSELRTGAWRVLRNETVNSIPFGRRTQSRLHHCGHCRTSPITTSRYDQCRVVEIEDTGHGRPSNQVDFLEQKQPQQNKERRRHSAHCKCRICHVGS